ncbi:MAG: MFS transporter [Thermosynechococcaceae cyanobacterium]
MSVLFWAGFCFWISLASLLPTLPLYVRDIGGSPQQVGWVMGAFAIGLLGSRKWLGGLTDRHSRKIVLIIGMLVAAIAPLGYAFCSNIGLLMVLRAFHGISIAAFATASSTLVVDLSPPERRGQILGYMSLVQPIGVALGPAIGGVMQAQLGYLSLFLTSALLAVVGLFCVGFVYDPMLAQAKPLSFKTFFPGKIDPVAGVPDSFWQRLEERRLQIPAVVMLLVGLAFGNVAAYIPLFMRQEVPGLNAGMFYTAAAFSSFGMRLVTGKASDRWGRGLFITFSLFCYVLSMAMLWLAHSEMSFIWAGLLEGAGGGILIPMMAALLADRSQLHERGRVFSLCMAGFDLGIAIAGPVFGFGAADWGYRHLFGLAGGCAGLGFLLFLTCNGKSPKQSLAFAFGRGRDGYAIPQA